MATILNARAWDLVDSIVDNPGDIRTEVEELDCGARILDFGVKASGSLSAGLLLAKVCTSGLADVTIHTGSIGNVNWPMVQVATDFPVRACLFSQYAGWEVKTKDYFAMGSGPVKGFAVTLCIGILTSMFTALLVSRGIINVVYGGRKIEKLAIGGRVTNG